jgi:hypothetical protein
MKAVFEEESANVEKLLTQAFEKDHRNTKYLPVYAEQAAQLSRLGATNKDIYSFFKIDDTTFAAWRNTYPEFDAAIQDARDAINSGKVEQALLKRAVGYEATEEEESINAKGTVKKTTRKVHIPGDVSAQKFFLEKRSGRRWPAKKEEGEGHKTFVAILNNISANTVPLAHVHAQKTVNMGGDTKGTQARPELPRDTI